MFCLMFVVTPFLNATLSLVLSFSRYFMTINHLKLLSHTVSQRSMGCNTNKGAIYMIDK